MKDCQDCVEQVMNGPEGSLESLMRTTAGDCATSTQLAVSELRLLLRHCVRSLQSVRSLCWSISIGPASPLAFPTASSERTRTDALTGRASFSAAEKAAS